LGPFLAEGVTCTCRGPVALRTAAGSDVRYAMCGLCVLRAVVVRVVVGGVWCIGYWVCVCVCVASCCCLVCFGRAADCRGLVLRANACGGGRAGAGSGERGRPVRRHEAPHHHLLGSGSPPSGRGRGGTAGLVPPFIRWQFIRPPRAPWPIAMRRRSASVSGTRWPRRSEWRAPPLRVHPKPGYSVPTTQTQWGALFVFGGGYAPAHALARRQQCYRAPWRHGGVEDDCTTTTAFLREHGRSRSHGQPPAGPPSEGPSFKKLWFLVGPKGPHTCGIS
jgi:hypothetical protein